MWIKNGQYLSYENARMFALNSAIMLKKKRRIGVITDKRKKTMKYL